ncbi:uncharacterized protein LOC129959997 [Argiope bruennichi]|uniref:uncharacterized protein LOC129959997 n=1 Tax=Argiope bruennichi TaxID=94029 RepID=UPI002494C690|nr:uncharacterized protein LOC129959997 [Argiope bruennichi]
MGLTEIEAAGCREILNYLNEHKVLRIFAWKFGLEDPASIVACLERQRLLKGYGDSSHMTTRQKAIDYIVRDASNPLEILSRQDVRKEHMKKYLESRMMGKEAKGNKAARLKNIILSTWLSSYRVPDEALDNGKAVLLHFLLTLNGEQGTEPLPLRETCEFSSLDFISKRQSGYAGRSGFYHGISEIAKKGNTFRNDIRFFHFDDSDMHIKVRGAGQVRETGLYFYVLLTIIRDQSRNFTLEKAQMVTSIDSENLLINLLHSPQF